jgi:hypothetical protein
MFKLIKYGLIGGVVLVLAGGFFFGRDLFSYAFTSGKMVRTAVRDSIPPKFDLQRARDLLEDLIPEMRANLKLVAEEEVEVANLEKEVGREREVVASQRSAIQKMRHDVEVLPATAAETDRKDQVEDLSRKFDRFRSNEQLLATKEKLLANRRKNLQTAVARLEKTRIARVELAAQIQSLEAQFNMVEAQGSPNDLRLSDTKLAQTQRLIGDLKKRLEVAQRVLERESELNDPEPAKKVSRQGLLEEIDDHFRSGTSAAPASTSPFPSTVFAECPSHADGTR